jgi:hypothetical protein
MLLKHAQFLCFLLLFQLFEDLQLNVFIILASTGKPVAEPAIMTTASTTIWLAPHICIIICGVFALTIQGHTGKPVAVPIVITCLNTFELSICISDNACLVYQQIVRLQFMYICILFARVNRLHIAVAKLCARDRSSPPYCIAVGSPT